MRTKISLVFLLAMTRTVLWADDNSSIYLSFGAGTSDVKVNGVIVDPLGRRMGENASGTFYKEIPEASYAEESPPGDDLPGGQEGVSTPVPKHVLISIHPIVKGEYKLNLYGISPGQYSLNIEAMDTSGARRLTPLGGISSQGTVSTSTVKTYRLIVDTAPNAPAPTLRTSFFDSLTFSDRSAGSCTNITMSGNSQVGGFVLAGGPLMMSGNTKIAGAVQASNVVKAGNATIQGSVVISSTVVDCSPVDLTALATDLQAANDNNRLPAANFHNGILKLSGNDKVTIPAGKYLLESLDVGGNGKLTADGSVHLLVKGAVALGGNTVVTGGSDFLLFSNSTAPLSLDGNAQVTGTVYLPQAAIKAGGNAKVTGHLFGKGIELSGNSRVQPPQ